MAGENAFQVEGTVIEALPNSTCRVELANGHRVLAFATGRSKERVARLAPGNRVKLQLSPYDLSQGRLLIETEEIET